MAYGGVYSYDAILLHRKDKTDKAESLCRTIAKYGEKTGRPLNISTFDSFCSIAKQELQNLHDAVEQSRYIMCMEDYYDESFKSVFFADAALLEKQKRLQFILLKHDRPMETEHPTRDALQGITLISSSALYANDLDKLVRELTGRGTQCIKTELGTRTQSSHVTKDGEDPVLHGEVVEDATPVCCGSQVFSSTRGGHGAEGQNLAEKSALSKQTRVWETKRNTNNPKQKGDKQKASDTVILHTDDETSLAESLSKDLQEHALQTGRNLRVQLYGRVSHPGKQEIRNLNEILLHTKNIICSPGYYRREQCSANVALQHKMEDYGFFLMYVESKELASVSARSIKGIQITHNWQFVNEGDRENLASHLCGVDDDVTPEDMAENKSKYPYSERPLTNSVGSLHLSSQNSPDESSLTERKVVYESDMSSTDGIQNEVRSHSSSSALLSSSQRNDETTQEGSAGSTNNSNNNRPRETTSGSGITHPSDNTDSLPGTGLIMDCSYRDLPVETHELQRSASALVGFPETPGRDEPRERIVEASGTSAAGKCRPKMRTEGATPCSFPSDLQHDLIRRQQIPDGASHLHEEVLRSTASARPVAAIAPVRNQAEQGPNIHNTTDEQREVVRNVDVGNEHYAEQAQHIPNVTDEQLEALRDYNDGEGFL